MKSEEAITLNTVLSKFVTVLAAGALLLTGCAGSAGTPRIERDAAPSPDVEVDDNLTPAGAFGDEPLGKFTRWRAMRHVRKLAGDIGVRVRATRGERRGASYIARKFRDLGYEVRVREFPVDDGTSRNVVAWWPGSSDFPFVLGAHMDTVAGAPGANDNASGVAVLLETARLVRNKQPARYLKFVAFGSEEYGSNGVHHVGSTVFVRRLGREGRRKTPGMISVDMIADGRPLLIGTSGIGPEVVARSLHNKLDNGSIDVEYRTLCDCSDNGPFEHAGIPAAFMWSGTEPNYHDPSDTVANMDPRDLVRAGKGVRIFVDAINRRLVQRYREF